MKRLLCILLTVCLLTPALALAGESALYISNPNPADRLHLREQPDKNARSIGKFYTGTPITQISDGGGEWVKVRVDGGSNGLPMEGWMQYKYLSTTKPANAMPQYVTGEAIADVIAIGKGKSIPAGTPVALMGVNEADHSWFMKAYLTGGTVSFSVRENHPALLPLPQKGCNAYISNPDAKDRLHLRATPSKNGKDMGKYYNGCIATLLGFSEDGQWLKVQLYGRTGWMMRQYVYIEGQGPNPCLYGIPTVNAAGGQLFSGVQGTGSAQTLPQGAQVEVLGLVDNTWLHVRYTEQTGSSNHSQTGYIRRSQTSFQEQ